MAPDLNRRLREAAVARIAAHTDELTALDQAIGDGDHGFNMKRGFEAIAAVGDELDALPLGPALQKAGMTLVMKVGGASGPLYGSFLMAMGKAMAAGEDFAAGLGEGVAAVKKRGKSEAGEKTMLDVLVPVLAAVAAEEPLAAVREAAREGLEATREMKATKGRASFLGERSIGHLDPGARSSALLVEAVCDVLEEKV
jgi:phosphoenolpyruvate---glycerone phosphotransferase subunit DhaL